MAIRAAHRNPIRSVARGIILSLGKIKRFIINLLTATSTRNSPTTGITDGLLVTYPANTPSFNEGALQNYGAGTNYVIQSEDFTTTWSLGALVVTPDSIIAPDGNTTADEITDSAAGSPHQVFQAQPLVAGSYTASVFAKKNTLQYLTLHFGSGTDWSAATFDLDSCVVTKSQQAIMTGLVASIEDVGNGFCRLRLTATTAAIASGAFFILTTSDTGTPTYVSFGNYSYIGTGQSLYVWGAQLNAGEIALPYQPTTTAAESFSADVTTVDNKLITPSSGAIAVEWAAKKTAPTTGYILGMVAAATGVTVTTADRLSWQFGGVTTLETGIIVTADEIRVSEFYWKGTIGGFRTYIKGGSKPAFTTVAGLSDVDLTGDKTAIGSRGNGTLQLDAEFPNGGLIMWDAPESAGFL